MYETNSQEKRQVKFPRITPKTKSLPSQKLMKTPNTEISAKSWLFYTPTKQYGQRTNAKRQIASLTKIMTSICAIELCQKFSINLTSTYFKVTEWAANTNGTSANLIGHAWVSVEDLLYGLMLPSGNDAAVVLAENLGAIIYFDKIGDDSVREEIRSIDVTEDKKSVYHYMQEFMMFMNEKSIKLKMYRTRFANPHGLDAINHYSCCEDVLIMCKQLMKIEKLRKVVSTQVYKAKLKFHINGKVIVKPSFWKNTNKLLGTSEIIGIKTGITSKAGGCLTTCMKDKNGEKIVIVLGCASTEHRFSDTQAILSMEQ